MVKLIPIVVALLFGAPAHAGTPVDLGDLNIPASRLDDWTKSGIEGGIPDTSGWSVQNVSCNGSNDWSTLQAVVNNAPDYTIIQLPAGTCKLDGNQDLRIFRSNIVVRGAGRQGAPTGTTLIVGGGQTGNNGFGQPSCSGMRGSIEICGQWSSKSSLSGGFARGSTLVTAASSSHGFAAGDWGMVSENCDPCNESNYCAHSQGVTKNCISKQNKEQIVQVTSVSGNQIRFSPALRNTFGVNGGTGVRITKMLPVESVGVESLRLEHQRPADGKFNGPLTLERAVNSWVQDLHFYRPYLFGVVLREAAHNEVRNSSFEEMGCAENGPCDYAGHYTVNFQQGATDNAVYSNTFEHIYIPVIFAGGSNGNVFSYNYFTNSRCANGGSHGIFFHGGFPSSNLIEGNNIDCSITLDSFWGQQGPHNTLFRNRLRDNNNSIIRAHNDGGRHVTDYLNVLANNALGFAQQPFCKNYSSGDCFDLDASVSYLWVERNVYRDTRHGGQCTAKDQPYGCCWGSDSGPACRFGMILFDTGTTPASTTDCGSGSGPGGCGTSADTNAGPAQSAPSFWSSEDIPESLWHNAAGAPSWWCKETSWPAIGADVDDFGGALAHLPAERRHLGMSCTPVGSAGSPPPADPTPLAAPVLRP